DVVIGDAAYERTRASANTACSQNLSLNERDGIAHALHALDTSCDGSIVVKGAVDRLDDQVTVDAKNPRQKLGTETVHHGHDDDQRRNTKHDPDEGDH